MIWHPENRGDSIDTTKKASAYPGEPLGAAEQGNTCTCTICFSGEVLVDWLSMLTHQGEFGRTNIMCT